MRNFFDPEKMFNRQFTSTLSLVLWAGNMAAANTVPDKQDNKKVNRGNRKKRRFVPFQDRCRVTDNESDTTDDGEDWEGYDHRGTVLDNADPSSITAYFGKVVWDNCFGYYKRPKARNPKEKAEDDMQDLSDEEFAKEVKKDGPRSVMREALKHDARKDLLNKMGVKAIPQKAKEVECTLVHPLKIRTSQEVWINSQYDSLQFCHTTILISAQIEEKDEEAEIRKSYRNGDKYVDDCRTFQRNMEMYMLEHFVSKHVFILRRNCIVQKDSNHEMKNSGKSVKCRLLDMKIVGGDGVRRRRQLNVHLEHRTHKTDEFFLEQTHFFFVFNGRPPKNEEIDDPIRDPNSAPQPDDILFQEAAITGDGYVTVMNKVMVPMRGVEKGFLSENELKIVSHTRTFVEDQKDNGGELKIYRSDTVVIEDDDTITTTKRAVSPDPPAPVPAKRRKEDILG